LFKSRGLCLTDLPEVALSDFEAVALSWPAAVAGDGSAKDTKSPAANIKAAPALALTVMWNLPICPPPKGEMRPCRVSAARRKKGIFGQDRAKAGQWWCVSARLAGIF
jgi:hypothetical protein